MLIKDRIVIQLPFNIDPTSYRPYFLSTLLPIQQGWYSVIKAHIEAYSEATLKLYIDLFAENR